MLSVIGYGCTGQSSMKIQRRKAGFRNNLPTLLLNSFKTNTSQVVYQISP